MGLSILFLFCSEFRSEMPLGRSVIKGNFPYSLACLFSPLLDGVDTNLFQMKAWDKEVEMEFLCP